MEACPCLPMLRCELKRSPGNGTLSETLASLLASKFGESAANFRVELDKLERLRARACILPNLSIDGLEATRSYYCQLHLLRNRFGNEAFTFEWYTNANDKSSKQVGIFDFDYELCAILYNVGATHVSLGCEESRDDSDSMKRACTHFQHGAWVMHSLPDLFPMIVESGVLDMAVDLLAFLAQLFLAQAQECILEKSLRDSRKASIIVKVAAQVVVFYKAALNKIEESNKENEYEAIADSVGHKKSKLWQKYLELKIAFYDAITHLYLGVQADEESKMGHRLAYMEESAKNLNVAVALCKNLSSDSELDKKQLELVLTFANDVIAAKLDNARKENEFIYHEKVPEISSLPEPKGASLVKGLGFEVTDPKISGEDIFSRIVPLKAHEASSLYSETKATLLREIGTEIEACDSELAFYMSSLSLEEIPSAEDHIALPQELIESAANLSVKGDILKNLNDAMARIASISSDVDASLSDINELIENEKEEMRSFEATFGKQSGTSIIKSELEVEANKYRDAHKMASESNVTLHKAVKAHIENLKLMTQPLESLKQVIPSMADLGEESEANITEVRRLLSKVEEMQTQRVHLMSCLRQELHDDDITTKILAQSSESELTQEFFNKEMDKYQPKLKIIRQNLSAQKNILTALTESNARYADTRQTIRELLEARESRIASLTGSAQAYDDLLVKAAKGLEFYDKLESNVSKLLKRIEETVETEKQKREAILAKNFRTLSTAQAPPSSMLTTGFHNPSTIEPSAPQFSPDTSPIPQLPATEKPTMPNTGRLTLRQVLEERKKGKITPSGQSVGTLAPSSTTAITTSTLGATTIITTMSTSTLDSSPVPTTRYLPPSSIPMVSPQPSTSSSQSLSDAASSNRSIPSSAISAQVSAKQIETSNLSMSTISALNSSLRPQSGISSNALPHMTTVRSYNRNVPASSIQSGLPTASNDSTLHLGGYSQNQPYAFPAPMNSGQTVPTQHEGVNAQTRLISSSFSSPMSFGSSTKVEPGYMVPQMPQAVENLGAQQRVTQGVNPPDQYRQMMANGGRYVQQQQGRFNNVIPMDSQQQMQPQYQHEHHGQFYHQPQAQFNTGHQTYLSSQQYTQMGPTMMQQLPTQQVSVPTHHIQGVPQAPQIQPRFQNQEKAHQQPQFQQPHQAYPNSYQQPTLQIQPQLQNQGYPQLQHPGSVSQPFNQQQNMRPQIPLQLLPQQTLGQPGNDTLKKLVQHPQLPVQQPASYVKPQSETIALAENQHQLHSPVQQPISQLQQPNQSVKQPQGQLRVQPTPPSQQQPPPPLQQTQQHQPLLQQTQQHQPPLQQTQPQIQPPLQQTQQPQPPLQQTQQHQPQLQQIQQHQPPLQQTQPQIQPPLQQTQQHKPPLHQIQQHQPPLPPLQQNQHQPPLQQTQPQTQQASQRQELSEDQLPHQRKTQGEVEQPSYSPSNVTVQNLPSKNLKPDQPDGKLNDGSKSSERAAEEPQTTSNHRRQSSLDILVKELDASAMMSREDNVLKPQVVTQADRKELKQENEITKDLERADKMDPYRNKVNVDLLLEETRALDKKLSSFLNDPSSLEALWQEVQDATAKYFKANPSSSAISVARCYPMKNRLPEVLPFDTCRVTLPTTKDDYINASHIRDVSRHAPKFIVTQSPLKNGLADFWTMIWQEKVETVLCLLRENEVEEHFVYFPKERKNAMDVGNKLNVTLQSIKRAKHVERIFTIQHRETSTSRVVVHLQLASHGNDDACDNDLLSILRETLSYHRQQRHRRHPVVVHSLTGSNMTAKALMIASFMAEINVGPIVTEDLPNSIIMPDFVNVAFNICKQRKGVLRDRENLKQALLGILRHSLSILDQHGSHYETNSDINQKVEGDKQDLEVNGTLQTIAFKNSDTKEGKKANEGAGIDLDPLSQLDPFWTIKK